MVVALIGANGLSLETPTGGGEHEERAENSDSNQRVSDHFAAYHLAPAITDFISDENRECCNNDLEQNRHERCYTVNGVKTSSTRGKAQHIIHLFSATQLTRKVWSSCVEACSGKHPRCQQLRMTLASFVSKKRH